VEREDASVYSVTQLQWLKCNVSCQFDQMNFINRPVIFIFDLFPSNRNPHNHSILCQIKHNTRDIRHFRLCGSNQQLNIIASVSSMLPPRESCSFIVKKCLGLPFSFVSFLSAKKRRFTYWLQ